MPKLGIRGTATGRFRLNNVRVPKENILGPLGKGLRVALTVLDFGRTTFGACCTGAAKTCLRLAIEHANYAPAIQQDAGQFRSGKEENRPHGGRRLRDGSDDHGDRVAHRSRPRGLHDRNRDAEGFHDRALWDAVNDAFQIHGGSAYFDDSPLGRMLRDARINQIGEGSNEVLTSFIALVGMRGPGMEFKEIYDTMLKPWRPDRGKAWGAGLNRLGAAVKVPEVPVRNEALRSTPASSRGLIWRFNFAVNKALIAYREPVMEMQLDPGADRGCGDGIVRRHLRVEPLGFGVAGGRPQRNATRPTTSRPIFSLGAHSARSRSVCASWAITTTRARSQHGRCGARQERRAGPERRLETGIQAG